MTTSGTWQLALETEGCWDVGRPSAASTSVTMRPVHPWCNQIASRFSLRCEQWGLSVEVLTWFSVLDFFSCGVISVLRNQEESVTGRSYCTLLDCLCSWGQVGHVLELIVDWLTVRPHQTKVCIQPCLSGMWRTRVSRNCTMFWKRKL